jgi:hypothetical protein
MLQEGIQNTTKIKLGQNASEIPENVERPLQQ